jgi:hypothetical protein
VRRIQAETKRRRKEAREEACLLCGVQMGADHIAEHFAQCFDEHSPVDAAPAVDTDELTQTHSAAVRKEAEQIGALQVALFDESALGKPFPSSVILIILQMLDMPTLGRLGCVSRGWQKHCRASCRVRCAHEVGQLVQLLPARHRQLGSQYLGRTPAEQCRGVCRLEELEARWAAPEIQIFVKNLAGKTGSWCIRPAEAAVHNRFGVLSTICTGDLYHLVHEWDKITLEQMLLMNGATGRAMRHWDVPLLFYARAAYGAGVPRETLCVKFDLLLGTSVSRSDPESMAAFEAAGAVPERQQLWRLAWRNTP